MPIHSRVRWLALGVILWLAVWLTVSCLKNSRPETIRPQWRSVVQSLAASGQVGSRDESEVGAEVSQRVAHVDVSEGQQVRRGQCLARLESRLLAEQVRQARAAVNTAQAQLNLARRHPLASDWAILEAETAQSERSFLAQSQQAAERLRELQSGPTREEIQQAQGQFDTARVQLAQNQREALRMRKLLEEGFVTQQESERAETARATAQGGLRTASQRLRQLQLGTRPEELAQARAQLRQVQANYQESAALRKARLQNLAEQPRQEDVDLARARLEEARANLEVARQRLAQAQILAPYDGTITRLYLKAGQDTSSSQPILHMVREPGLELRADVDENNLGRLRAGQLALVSCDAYPEASFQARLREIAPEVNNSRGTVQIRLDPLRAPAWVRPGQTVSINLQLEPERRLLVLPLSCLSTIGRRQSVLRVADGRLEERQVEVGAAGADGFPVLAGLGPDDEVVLDPIRAQAGQAVR